MGWGYRVFCVCDMMELKGGKRKGIIYFYFFFVVEIVIFI